VCGRYTLAAFEDQLREEFELIEAELRGQRYNIAPTQSAPVVRAMETGHGRRIDELRWGLIPHWAKDAGIGNRMINARSEGVESKPSFRGPLRRRRCLIPTTGFYEWKKVDGGTKSRPRKQPYYIHMLDNRVFAFAGLWDCWKSAEGEVVESYTILTTEPSDCVRSLHDRMPVIISRGDYALWLDPKVQEVEPLSRLLAPYRGDDLVAHAVGTQVNSPARDDASLRSEERRVGKECRSRWSPYH